MRPQLSTYLQDNKWYKSYSPAGNTIWSKTEKISEYRPNKGRFQEVGKAREISASTLANSFTNYFKSLNYQNAVASRVGETAGGTDLLGAGLQATIIRHELRDGRGHILLQPSVRMKALSHVSEKEGYSTAFVNACLQQQIAHEDQHVANVDATLTFLSKQGLYLGHCTLVEDSKWSAPGLQGDSLLIYYADLGVGDCVHAVEDRTGANISDIGLGLERCAWAIGKHPNYFLTRTLPYEVLIEHKNSIDAIQTLTLLAMHGVNLTRSRSSQHMRHLAKIYAEHTPTRQPVSLVMQAQKYWEQFPTNQNGSIEAVYEALEQALVRSLGGSAHATLDDIASHHLKLRKIYKRVIDTTV